MATTNPYANSIVIKYPDGDISLERVPTNISTDTNSNSRVHTVLEGETLQGIAFQYYGDPGKWVLIADVNNLYNPFTELEADMEIIIP